MGKAIEVRAEYSDAGKVLKREWSVGAIVVWGIVALALIWSGRSLINVPSIFWQFK